MVTDCSRRIIVGVLRSRYAQRVTEKSGLHFVTRAPELQEQYASVSP
jgi:hypothetical protein